MITEIQDLGIRDLYEILGLLAVGFAIGLLIVAILRRWILNHISRKSQAFKQLALDMAKITHGYLSVSNFHRSLHVLSDDDTPLPDETMAASYLQVYGFKKVKDESILAECPDDVYFHPQILANYTFESLSRRNR